MSTGALSKVVFISDFYPEVHARWSGAEIACQRLRTLLTEAGIDVSVFTVRADFQENKPPFVQEVRLMDDFAPRLAASFKTLIPFDPLAYRFFLGRFKALSPDVVHLHNLKFMSFAPAAAARALGIPTVFSAYDNWAVCPRYCLMKPGGEVCEKFHGPGCLFCVPMKKKPFVAFRKPAFESFLKRLDAVAVLTASERRRAARGGVVEDKIHILPLPLFDGDQKNTPAPDKVVRNTILFVGRLEHGKGLHVLVEAMGAVLCRFKDARVVVVGEHSGTERYKNEVLARIAELGLEGVFSFMGKMGNTEIKELLLRSHLVVAPEQWPIAWPIFLTEAMSLGKLIVASRIGDIPEFIRDGQTGYLAAHDRPEDFSAKIMAALGSPQPINSASINFITGLCDRGAITRRLISIYGAAIRRA